MSRDVATRPWAIANSDFPNDGSMEEKLHFLLGYAVLAPSGHNTQPWLFQIEDDAVHLRADRRRSLPVVDPRDRALVISCGAALHHLRLALRHFGYEHEVVLLPEASDPDLLAIVRVVGRTEPSAEQTAMFEAITYRHTNRGRYEDRGLAPELVALLQAAAERHGAWLKILHAEERQALIDLIERGNRIQMANSRFRRELAAWIRPSRTSSGDGIPGYAFGIPFILSYLGPIFVRFFDQGRSQAIKDRKLAEGSPVLAVVGGEGDEPSDWLAIGQALGAVLLTARSEGIWAAFLNQPVEVAELRPEVRHLTGGHGYPQLVLRMGYAPDVPPTPRRDVAEVLA